MSNRGREQLLVMVVVAAMLALLAVTLYAKLAPVFHAVGGGLG